MGYWLFVIGCLLLVVCYWLFVIGYWLDQFRLYRNDLTAKARSARSKRRESLIQDDEERILYYWLLVIGCWLLVIGDAVSFDSANN
ncbi:MAG: hypothetical protein ACM65L_13595 [Microcoleus sp.]